MAENGPTALVTGGARRIGAAIIQDLAANGFSVAIHCNRSRDDADRLADEVARAGARVAVLPADLCDPDAAAGLIAVAAVALGPVRLLVNNASAFDDDSPADPDWQKWDRHFALHLKAPVLLASTMAKALPAGEDGLVVNVVDQRVWKLTPQFFSYTLSKSALWTATRTMAQGLAPRIRVNAIGPGPTLKNARQAVSDFRAQTDALPLGHGPLLTEFGATIRYLWQTPSITGQMIALDGGQHLAWQTPDVTGMRE
ncbi:SDR family oxidoreductase [Nitratireductor sp. CAU 1489]|uniref:SDR family oxidoreductase n=1 Tax=Nitratireductor arenosus TaxID=2682096 RepID=A0A844QQC5_9HYPH|nr:SDR family oxidoreductase [Nitratireductor arenosus]MVB00144.1 SDR family oxidoreductase [Nitratireductor arenosus]